MFTKEDLVSMEKPYNLSKADLRKACLNEAYLSEADLSEANLSWSDLNWSDLRGATLSGAYLCRANLIGANLSGANLNGADLNRSTLSWANLRGANLRGADLREVILQGAGLDGADLDGAKLPAFQICPTEGSFIGWKKVQGILLKLRIPASARRTSSLVGRKCRAEYVVVLEGAPEELYSRNCSYKNGEKSYPDKYDDYIRIECTHGIHFFVTREEAKAY